MSGRVVIVGAGQGGLQAAESLRAKGFEGEILLLGDEPHAPYNRPPLSKGLLLGEVEREQLTIRQPAALEKKRISLRTGAAVTALDLGARRVVLRDGEAIAYDALVLATGSRPRRLPVPGGDAHGVHCLRSLDDTLAIADDLAAARDVVVIGGGFIGLEMAAVARKLGKAVRVIECADRLMARVVSPQISAFYKDLHERHGVEIVLNAAVSEILAEDGRVSGVKVRDGREFLADMVVLGIGVEPNTGLAEAAGIACERGVIVDACGRTSAPDVYAIGDCAAQRLADGGLRRLESVQNAVELGKAAAAAIMGREEPFTAAPWFWSDQYDVKLQMVGLSAGHDQAVTRGQGGEDGLSWFYFRNGRLLAIDSLNRPADHMAGRRLLSGENTLTPEQAADEDFPLKDALARRP